MNLYKRKGSDAEGRLIAVNDNARAILDKCSLDEIVNSNHGKFVWLRKLKCVITTAFAALSFVMIRRMFTSTQVEASTL